MKQNLMGAICLSLAASMWGGMYVVMKFVLDYIPPITLVWVRYAIAFVVLFIALKMINIKSGNHTVIRKNDWLLLAWIGFIGYFVSVTFAVIGTKLSDAHTGALITSATPAFIVVFARFILKEKLTVRKIASVLLATLGVVIVIGWDTKVGTYLVGSLILIGSAIAWALLSVYVKVASNRLSSLTITTYAVFFALVFSTPAFVWELQSNDVYYQNISIVLGIIYLGVVATAGANFLWNKGMDLMDAGIGSLFFFFQPLVGSVLGWLLLHEKLDINFFIGGFIIMISVVIVTLQKKKSMSDAPKVVYTKLEIVEQDLIDGKEF